MKVKTLEDIPSSKGIIKAGEIIEITPGVMEKLTGRVELVTDGRDLPHWCQPGGCWCSEKLTGACIKPDCEYFFS